MNLNLTESAKKVAWLALLGLLVIVASRVLSKAANKAAL